MSRTGGSVKLRLSGRKVHTESVWGRIAGGQGSVLAGNYADIVVVTVSY
jgi:spore coat protein U-like protein